MTRLGTLVHAYISGSGAAYTRARVLDTLAPFSLIAREHVEGPCSFVASGGGCDPAAPVRAAPRKFPLRRPASDCRAVFKPRAGGAPLRVCLLVLVLSFLFPIFRRVARSAAAVTGRAVCGKNEAAGACPRIAALLSRAWLYARANMPPSVCGRRVDGRTARVRGRRVRSVLRVCCRAGKGNGP